MDDISPFDLIGGGGGVKTGYMTVEAEGEAWSLLQRAWDMGQEKIVSCLLDLNCCSSSNAGSA